MHKVIALVSALIALGLINWSIAQKEEHLETGKLVYLELAPVDPRSLMQGDYMALDFGLAREIYSVLPKLEGSRRWRHDVNAGDGHVVVSLDDNNVATYKRLHKDEPLSDDELLLFYRVRNGSVKFATNAFFFQEGDAALYEQAEYGVFKVDQDGELLLVDMADQKLSHLGEQTD